MLSTVAADKLGMSAPNLAGLESLALAIEAQSSHPPGHLLRVRLFAMELARRLELGQPELEAVQLAAVLHDVGEMAVPPGILFNSNLTPLEFEKMKTHAVAGALIAERADLPAEAVLAVRGHHERWDGAGYPDGLGYEAIPLGARILAVAECLAGAGFRELELGSGTAFDPRMAQAAVVNRVAMEAAVRQACSVMVAPAFHAALAAARREERLLCRLSAELGNSLSLTETFSTVDTRLKEMIAYRSLAVHRVEERQLVAAYVNGDDAIRLCRLAIGWGEGPCGEAAATRQPVFRTGSADEVEDPCGVAAARRRSVINREPVGGDLREAAAETGSPVVYEEFADGNGAPFEAVAETGRPVIDRAAVDKERAATPCSVIAIPLEAGGEVIGVLSLYGAQDALGNEDLRILLAIQGQLSVALHHSLHEERAEQLATADPLTGLPNRRALFQRLDSELARCRRSNGTLALLVCEIEGLARVEHESGAVAAQRWCKSIAAGLRQACREDDLVARMGESFVLALGGFSAHDLPDKLRLIDCLLAKTDPSGSLAAKVGAAYYPADGAYAEDLLACADLRLNALQAIPHRA